MMKISQEFAPPFKLIAPFFILGSIFFVFSVLFLYTFDIHTLSYTNLQLIAFSHLFLLGFVMMIIFGAMAQLVPVVLEVGHFGVELFYAIWPLLLVGSVMMVFGFLYSPALLPYGGMVVLISMMIFVGEIFLTIAKVEKLTLVMSSVLISNTFLFFGIIFGLLMALSFAGTISLSIESLLRAHVYSVLGGYIAITIMGLSIILVPMFTLAHSFSMRPLEISMWMMSLGVVSVVVGSLADICALCYTGYLLSAVAMLVYVGLIYKLYRIRPRKENDVYIRSLVVSYGSLIAAVTLFGVYFLSAKENFLLAGGWLLFFGFFAFLITGHLYKIIPFLVWFERFSPLVGKQKVPMLADMVPSRGSEAQLLFSSVGLVLVAAALIAQSNEFIYAGASFLLVGSLAFVRNVFYMINFK